MSFFDFNLLFPFCGHSTAFQFALEAADESWPKRLFSTRGLAANLPVSNLRRSIPRQSLRQGFFLLGSVPFSGLCAAHLPRKSPRYRSLSARPATQVVSHGFPWKRLSQHLGQRQRASRLANLRRLRSGSDCHRPRPVPRRTVCRGVVRDRVCSGLHHHRFMPGAFSLGKIPTSQKRRETAHAAGSAGPHSSQCLCDRGPGSRRQHSGPTASRSRSVLLARSRVCGFCPPVPVDPIVRFLRHARQEGYAILLSQLAPHRPIHGSALRPNHSTERNPNRPALSRRLAASTPRKSYD